MLGMAISALGLALVAGGAVRAADLGYTFKSVAALDTTVGGEPIHGDFEMGSANAAPALWGSSLNWTTAKGPSTSGRTARPRY